MFFAVAFLAVIGLQGLHWNLLIQVVPDRVRRWVPWVLLAIHLPLAAYMGFRISGHAAEGLGFALRPLARGALYFQLFTLVNLLFWAVALAIWKVKRKLGHTFDRGPFDPSRRAFLRKAAGGGVAVLAATSAGGAAQAYGDPEITRTTLWFSDLPPGLDGLKLVQLTDLHCGPLVRPGQVLRWRFLAEREAPDLLLVTGDFVDSLPGEVAPFVDAFRGFHAPLGRFAILGNHDYFTDPRPIW
ncbi:MAG TPA: metallophosphoesterase, partial [Holophaga sp.]|nr:metallophosphoesterase [Holophaga sp.]